MQPRRFPSPLVALFAAFAPFALAAEGGGSYDPTYDEGNDSNCAEHMVQSVTCGASAKKHALECCPGLACDGKFCVSANLAEEAAGAAGAEAGWPVIAQHLPTSVDGAGTGSPRQAKHLDLEILVAPTEENSAAAMVGRERPRQEELSRQQAVEEERLRKGKEEEKVRQQKEEKAERLLLFRKQKEEAERLRAAQKEENERLLLQLEEQQRREEANLRRPEEKKALVRLFGETNGEDWKRKGGWMNNDIDQCKWEGITCNEYGLVVNIILAVNHMSGNIPAMDELQQIEVIDLHDNDLEAVPPIRVDYPSLRHVNLANNRLRGTLSSMGYHLEFLDLSSNQISGRFEPWFDLDELCPSDSPSSSPSSAPTSAPSSGPSSAPSSVPSSNPSSVPSPIPSALPSSSSNPSSVPSPIPSVLPSSLPTFIRSLVPSSEPTSGNLTGFLASNNTNMTSRLLAVDEEVPSHLPICGSKLRHLNLGNNELEYVDLSELTSLQHLDLSQNKAMDQSLAELGIDNLKFLETINLGGSSKLTGELRIGHMQYLKHMDLCRMTLGGELSQTGILEIATLKEINLSEGNKFRGEFFFCNFTSLEMLNLGGNNLTGDLTACNLASLKVVDLSDNNYSGSLNFGRGQSKLMHLNLHRNAFTGTLPSFEGLSELSTLHLGENRFTGKIPDLSLPSLRSLNISFNQLTGTLPTSISKLTLCFTIDLGYQARSEYIPSTGQRITRGIRGRIPSEIGQLQFLQTLVLSSNLLSSTIPDSLVQLTYLKLIDVEDNLLSGTIPHSVNLLELLETVKLARNRLTGAIPDLGGSSDTVRRVTMAGNSGLLSPAPFTLCDLDELDLRTNPEYCPSDRSALAAFYASTKGSEWLRNDGWVTNAHHCDWYGVTCSEDREKTLKLELDQNGLAGQLPGEFFEIKTLRVLSLSDNDIRGALTPLIKEFRDLAYLRLSYNRLTSIPEEIKYLEKLALVHLHSNRLEGNANMITVAEQANDVDLPEFRFIADCGDPQDVSDPFVCDNCDMCCNSLEECQAPRRMKFTAAQATGILVAGALMAMCFAWVVVRFLVRNKMLRASESFANKAAGEESVYSFYLSDNKLGWFIASGSVAIQILVFALFLSAASFENDDGDFVYSWRCPVNTPDCNDERAVDSYGWMVWGFLVAAALLDDIMNGIKLIFVSASRGSAPAFFTGMSLTCVTALAVYTSLSYNIAIAMTNTELIVNAVILLIVNDIDEQVFSIVRIVNSKFTKKITNDAEEYSAYILHQHLEDENDADAMRQNGTLSERDRRRLWRDGSGDLLSVGSGESYVSPSKVDATTDVELLRMVQSLQKQVQFLQKLVQEQSLQKQVQFLQKRVQELESSFGPKPEGIIVETESIDGGSIGAFQELEAERKSPPPLSSSAPQQHQQHLTTIRIGTRPSPLAMRQAEEVADALRRVAAAFTSETSSAPQSSPLLDALIPSIEIVPIDAKGDVRSGLSELQDLPLAMRSVDFTSTLDDALRSGAIDVAVHSLKDVPPLHRWAASGDLMIASHLPRADPRDVLVGAPSLSSLSPGAKIGSSSIRRRAQLLALRRDVEVVHVRGNVQARLEAMRGGGVDALVLAKSGLDRLGGEGGSGRGASSVVGADVPMCLLDEMLPGAAQGIVCAVCRIDESGGSVASLKTLLERIDDPDARVAASAERAFLDVMDGIDHPWIGRPPVAALMKRTKFQSSDEAGREKVGTRGDGGWFFRGLLAKPDGTEILRSSRVFSGGCDEEEAVALAREVAREILSKAGPAFFGGGGLKDFQKFYPPALPASSAKAAGPLRTSASSLDKPGQAPHHVVSVQ